MPLRVGHSDVFRAANARYRRTAVGPSPDWDFRFPYFADLRPDDAPEGKLDGGENDKGGQGFGEVLGVLGKTPVASEPGEGALDHPAAAARQPFMSSLRLTISMRTSGTFTVARNSPVKGQS
jgi:hypothetical protein